MPRPVNMSRRGSGRQQQPINRQTRTRALGRGVPVLKESRAVGVLGDVELPRVVHCQGLGGFFGRYDQRMAWLD